MAAEPDPPVTYSVSPERGAMIWRGPDLVLQTAEADQMVDLARQALAGALRLPGCAPIYDQRWLLRFAARTLDVAAGEWV